MNANGSVIDSICSRIRFHVDEPDIDGRFDNNSLIRNVINSSMADVWARLNIDTDNRIVIRLVLPIVEGQQYYTLPPFIKSIRRVCKVDQYGNVTEDYKPKGEFFPLGPGWSVEGNQLNIRPFPTEDRTDLEVWFVPSGEFRLCKGTGTLSSDLETFTLDSITSGDVERRPNGYLGAYLRLIHASDLAEEERIIDTHTISAGPVYTVVARTPFTTGLVSSGSSKTFEICPPGLESMIEAVALRAAIKLTSPRHRNVANGLLSEYQSSMKTLVDNLRNQNGRVSKGWQANTIDNPDSMLVWF